MKRFDLLRSPLLLAAVGVLLLNDFVLKAAFHNWLTGKLSDVAGLAAFTIFCCALWPRHVRAVGGCIAALFVFWKSPYSTDAIEVANAVLPFTIGRTVDYSDLIALPVVWLVCRNADRLPLIDLGRIGVWLTAGVCLFAFTATSHPIYSYRTVTTAAEVPGPPATVEERLQQMLDEIAARHGLGCGECAPLSKGRYYFVLYGSLSIGAGFDADKNRLLFDAHASGDSQGEVDKMRPVAERLKAEIEQELRARFPAITLSEWTRPSFTTIVVRVTLPPEGDAYYRALAVADSVLQSSGLPVVERADERSVTSEERIRVSPTYLEPSLTARTLSCASSGRFVIWVSSGSGKYAALAQRMVDRLVAGFSRAFGKENVTVAPRTGDSVGCGS